MKSFSHIHILAGLYPGLAVRGRTARNAGTAGDCGSGRVTELGGATLRHARRPLKETQSRLVQECWYGSPAEPFTIDIGVSNKWLEL
jgi:hypothetical protein